MKFKPMMSITSFLGSVYALGSLIIPVQFWGFFGMEITGEGIWAGRIVGLLVASNVYLVWSSRQLTDQASHRIVANFVVMVWALYGLVSLWGQFTGDFNGLNWINIAACAIFGTLTLMVKSE